MAKLFASEVAMEIALNAVRIHGGYGYSTEYDVERYFRDAPLMIVGEGTNEIQRNVIAGAAGVPRRHLSACSDRPGVSDAAPTTSRRDRGRALPRRARGCPPSPSWSPRHGCRRQTVRRAFQDLVAEGVVYRVPGRGTYANESGAALPASARVDRGPDEPVRRHHHGGAVRAAPPRRRRRRQPAAPGRRRRLHRGVPAAARRRPVRADPGAPARGGRAAGARRPRDWPTARSARTPSSGCSSRICSDPIAEAAQSITVGPADDDVADGGAAARRVIRCCGWTGCTPMLPVRPSSWRSATSCPSSTPTGSRCAAPASGISVRSRAHRVRNAPKSLGGEGVDEAPVQRGGRVDESAPRAPDTPCANGRSAG